jgi:hypothetical protein
VPLGGMRPVILLQPGFPNAGAVFLSSEVAIYQKNSSDEEVKIYYLSHVL